MAEHEGVLAFDVDAALLVELGEQLVARKSVALSELVKNAYDADATAVTIELRDVLSPGGSITIEDNGSGMPFEIVKNQWMRIATTSKVTRGPSPRFKRTLTGAKGVGRFATRKLAHHLLLETRFRAGAGTFEVTVVNFDWDAFRPGSRLADVTTAYRTRTEKGGRAGTRLVLTNVREAWTEAEVKAVREDLQTLTPPFTSNVTKGTSRSPTGEFDVVLVAPEFPGSEGSLLAKFLSAAVARLDGRVLDDGRVEYELHLRGRSRSYRFKPSDLSLPELAGAGLEVHLFRYDRESLAGTGVGVGPARDLGAAAGGVKIYLDGFRVFPYGDPGDDWLALDADRGRRRTGVDAIVQGVLEDSAAGRPLLQLPGNNNIFGAVYISREDHPGLRPTISRERLVETEAFSQLTRFARVGIEWMVVQRANVELRPSAKKARTSSPSPSDALALGVTSLREHANSLAPSESDSFLAELDEFERTLKQADDLQLEKIRVLRILASAGTMWLVLIHQLRATLDAVKRMIKDIRRGGAAAESALDRLETWALLLEAQASELGLLLGRSAREDARSLAVAPVVEQVLGTFAGYADDRGIHLENAVPPNVRTPPMRTAELHAVLINLITNSLKAVLDVPDRRIRVEAKPRGEGIDVSVLDTGIGIRRRDRERAFEPFQTTSSPDPVLGVGTGLGLAIVRDIVSEHAGTARFVDPVPPWRTEIVVHLPPSVDR